MPGAPRDRGLRGKPERECRDGDMVGDKRQPETPRDETWARRRRRETETPRENLGRRRRPARDEEGEQEAAGPASPACAAWPRGVGPRQGSADGGETRRLRDRARKRSAAGPRAGRDKARGSDGNWRRSPCRRDPDVGRRAGEEDAEDAVGARRRVAGREPGAETSGGDLAGSRRPYRGRGATSGGEAKSQEGKRAEPGLG